MKRYFALLCACLFLLCACGEIPVKPVTAAPETQAEETTAVAESADKPETQTVLLEGSYLNELINEELYHSSLVTISGQSESSIDFEISTVNGMSIDYVNIGELSGTAEKIEENCYRFEKTEYDVTSVLLFFFDPWANTMTVSESYTDGYNPYAGAGVYFAGTYTKQ